MLIVDDILFGLPWKGTMWVLEQLRQAVEREATDEKPIMEAILENEMALEDGRLDPVLYEERSRDLMARLREIRERKKAMAEAAAEARGEAPSERGKPISGKASLDIDLDFGGYGHGSGGSK